jgi:hypothetical protein
MKTGRLNKVSAKHRINFIKESWKFGLPENHDSQILDTSRRREPIHQRSRVGCAECPIKDNGISARKTNNKPPFPLTHHFSHANNFPAATRHNYCWNVFRNEFILLDNRSKIKHRKSVVNFCGQVCSDLRPTDFMRSVPSAMSFFPDRDSLAITGDK